MCTGRLTGSGPLSSANKPVRAWAAVLVALCGVLAAIALPFAPVHTERTTVTWPVPGEPAVSTTALLIPYRPATLTAVLPCAALQSGTDEPVTVLATAADGDGMTITAQPGGAVLRADGLTVDLPASGPECAVTVLAADGQLSISTGDDTTVLAERPVPKVFGFRTELDPEAAAGMTVTAQTVSPFETSPAPAKLILIAMALVAAVTALTMLRRGPPVRWRRPRRRWIWLIDAGVITLLGGWAVIGPLAVDDGWATTIARTVADTGSASNYYRWWNAAEVPFALSQQLLSPLTEISLAPLWLRMPSTLLAVATWFVVSRGVLGAALPRLSHTPRIRLLAALFLLVAWLPFNLGTRPESYVAFGVTAVLALVWRARTPAGLGAAVLAAALTVPISPTAIIVVAPFVVFGPKIGRILRGGGAAVQVALLCCVASVSITVIFADQTWTALRTATEWHTFFGPSLPWNEELQRYRYLFSGDQQGSAPKRLPLLLAAAMTVIVAALWWRRGPRTGAAHSAQRLAAVLVVALLALAVVPSKWSYHLGTTAGLIAALLTVAVVATAHCTGRIAVSGAVVVSGAAALAFSGPNAWWLSTVYDVPWPDGPIRPAGLPFDSPLWWLGLAVLVTAGQALLDRTRVRRIVSGWPGGLTVAAATVAVLVLVGSFVAAPLRRPAGALAAANLDRLTGQRVCGLADDIQVLPDGPVLAPANSEAQTDGFASLAGHHPAAPPPDPPGAGTSAVLWGSYGLAGAGSVTTEWFELPPLSADDGVAVSVSGRTDGANALVFEFGRADGDDVRALGESRPPDRVAVDEDPENPLWRSIGVDSAQIPPDADRVRIHAADGGDDSWLAVTGPRLRTAVGLTAFLAEHGPVLISWPQSFLFPCVHDITRVSGGVAQTPRMVIESPRPFFEEDRNPDLGGSFAGLTTFDDLHEVPTRLVGHPEVDWGTVRVAPADPVRDAYAVSTDRRVVWGVDDTGRVEPER